MTLPVLSHSFLAKWDQCPRQAHHAYVLKDLPKEDSEALRWGNRVHKAMESRIGGKPLPDEMAHWEPLVAQLDGRGAKAELMLGMKEDGTSCGFFDNGVWLRGKVDVLVAFNATAVLFDWKTGKRKEDPEELEIHAVLLKAHKPHLESFSGRYVWLKDGEVGQRHELSAVKDKAIELHNRAAEIRKAFDAGYFPPRQTPLCGWCPVKSCEFHPGERK